MDVLTDILDILTAAVVWAFMGGVFLVLYIWAAS